MNRFLLGCLRPPDDAPNRAVGIRGEIQFCSRKNQGCSQIFLASQEHRQLTRGQNQNEKAD